MRRLTNVEYDDASPEIKAIYDEIMVVSGTPDVWNMLKMFGHNKVALRAMWGMLHYVVLEGELPALLKQLILFKISVEYGNDYCTSLHGCTILRMDRTIAYDELVTMANNADMKFPTSYTVAIDVVSRMALQTRSIRAADYDWEAQLLDEGFSEEEIEELVAVAVFGVLMNTLSDIVGADPDEFLISAE